MKFGIILGSTRPGRRGEPVARWVHQYASKRENATYELVDLADYDLDLLDDPVVPGAAKRQYQSEKTRRWSAKIDEFDGYVFVTPEYNHGVPAALKNAVDVLYPEWNHKAVAFVAYGADGGVRSVEQWRQITANVQLQAIRGQVSISEYWDYDDQDTFQPLDRREGELTRVFDQLERLAQVMAELRQ